MFERTAVIAGAVGTDGLVLCARGPRDGPLPGLWEFSDGEVGQGETPKKALERELDEELLLSVGAIGLELVTTRYGR